MNSVRWIAEANGTQHNAEGYRYWLNAEFDKALNENEGGWYVSIMAVVPATRTDTEYEIVIDEAVFWDLFAGKMWAESVDLRALADDLLAESSQAERFAIDDHLVACTNGEVPENTEQELLSAYEAGGHSGVCDWVYNHHPDWDAEFCEPCDAVSPVWNGVCAACFSVIDKNTLTKETN